MRTLAKSEGRLYEEDLERIRAISTSISSCVDNLVKGFVSAKLATAHEAEWGSLSPREAIDKVVDIEIGLGEKIEDDGKVSQLGVEHFTDAWAKLDKLQRQDVRENLARIVHNLLDKPPGGDILAAARAGRRISGLIEASKREA